jgi:hydroxymethylbilane synthase
MIVRIGTRGSPLALAQAREVQSGLARALGLSREDLPIVEIKTSGDRILDRPLSQVGGKGLFTKEIEEALYGKSIDIAVHSMKDLETVMPPGLEIGAVLEREDVRDAFVSLSYETLDAMPAGARVGTSSLRRGAQLRHVRPDLEVVEFRGNVQTRLAKLESGVADATFLACAGLNRLGRSDVITVAIPVTEMLPAVAQGAIGVQMRSGDSQLAEALSALEHAPTRASVDVERAFLRELDGSCRTPVAGLATWSGSQLSFMGEILTPDGSQRLTAARSGPPEQLADLAREAARELLVQAGADFFKGGRS